MQLDYNSQMDMGTLGQLADSGYHDVVSKNLSADTAEGLFVCADGATGAKVPAAATDITSGAALGVLLRNLAREYRSTDTAGVGKANSAGSIARKGRVVVNSAEAVNTGDDVYVRYATGTQGEFSKTSTSMQTAKLPGARWVSTTSGAGLAVLEINLPA